MSLHIDPVAFTRAWQKSSAVAEVAKLFGLSPGQARSKAAHLRRSGFPLKKIKPRMTEQERARIRRALR